MVWAARPKSCVRARCKSVKVKSAIYRNVAGSTLLFTLMLKLMHEICEAEVDEGADAAATATRLSKLSRYMVEPVCICCVGRAGFNQSL